MLYNISPSIDDIRPFLLTHPPFSSYGGRTVGHRDQQREAVFVRECNNDMDIGLYVDPRIVDRLEHAQHSLDDIACAGEGVSHFLYLTHRWEERRQCSLLELELQGEVDKFVLLNLLTMQNHKQGNHTLFTQQFERAHFDAGLTQEERDRYETASHFAAKFCERLLHECFFPYRPERLMKTIQPFFLKNLSAKLEGLIP